MKKSNISVKNFLLGIYFLLSPLLVFGQRNLEQGELYIDDFLINNVSVNSLKDSILIEGFQKGNIQLSRKLQNDFVIKWNIKNQTLDNDKYRFVYRLNGLEDNFNYVSGDVRLTRYMRLKRGAYIFQIKYSKNGIWNINAIELKIFIK